MPFTKMAGAESVFNLFFLQLCLKNVQKLKAIQVSNLAINVKELILVVSFENHNHSFFLKPVFLPLDLVYFFYEKFP